MAGEFFRLFLQFIEYLWPLRRVKRFQRALYTICGRWQWEVGPGVWPVLPWFCEVEPEPVVGGTVWTPRLDITASDGTMVTFQVSANVRIVNLSLAVNAVDAYMETTQERIASLVATKLTKIDAARLTPEKRGPLLTDLRKWVDAETQKFGVETSDVSFTTFVVNPRPFRLLGDNAQVAPW